jgi:hypothetical protein
MREEKQIVDRKLHGKGEGKNNKNKISIKNKKL